MKTDLYIGSRNKRPPCLITSAQRQPPQDTSVPTSSGELRFSAAFIAAYSTFVSSPTFPSNNSSLHSHDATTVTALQWTTGTVFSTRNFGRARIFHLNSDVCIYAVCAAAKGTSTAAAAMRYASSRGDTTIYSKQCTSEVLTS